MPELLTRMEERGGSVPAPASGYLQFIRHDTLVRLAARKGRSSACRTAPGTSSCAAIRWRPCGRRRRAAP